MTLPDRIPRVAEPLVSFNFADIRSGTNYGIFYGAEGSNQEFFVTQNTSVGSTHIWTSDKRTLPQNSVLEEVLNKDFDIEFRRTVNIKGDVFLIIPIGIQGSSGGQIGYRVELRPEILHVTSGGTETSLGTDVSDNILPAGLASGEFDDRVFFCRINLANRVHFKAGEKLRISVIIWAATTSSTGDKQGTVGFGSDPLNRSGNVIYREIEDQTERIPFSATARTRMEFQIPFETEI